MLINYYDKILVVFGYKITIVFRNVDYTLV